LKVESGKGEDIQTLDQSGSEPKAGEILLEACWIAPISPVYASEPNDAEAAWARRQDRVPEHRTIVDEGAVLLRAVATEACSDERLKSLSLAPSQDNTPEMLSLYT